MIPRRNANELRRPTAPSPKLGSGATVARRHRLWSGRTGQSLILATALVAVLPGIAAATAYSTLVYKGLWTPPGESNARTVCVQSGMVDTARNYGQIVIFSNSSGSCAAPNHAVPAGWISTEVSGFRDGAYCGSSGYYYSTSSTSAWQLWDTTCTNPAGTQTFYTLASGQYWNGSGYTWTGQVRSPSQNY